MSQSYVIDCLLEPIFWIVDNFAGNLGQVSIWCVLFIKKIHTLLLHVIPSLSCCS